MSCAKPLGTWTKVIRVIDQRAGEERSDAELMASLGRGDMPALGVLYMRYCGLVASAIIAAAPSLPRQEVEDLCQDVFMTVGKSAAKYREKGKLKSWLYSVAVRTTRKRTRSLRVRQRLLQTVTGQPVAIAERTPNPGGNAMAKVDIERALSQLSDVQRRLLILFEHQGLSGEEIAELLDMKLNTVWSHLRRARAAMSAYLEEAGPPAQLRG
jgi:RNA polymerase sigma factor (sigma-70 family)